MTARWCSGFIERRNQRKFALRVRQQYYGALIGAKTPNEIKETIANAVRRGGAYRHAIRG